MCKAQRRKDVDKDKRTEAEASVLNARYNSGQRRGLVPVLVSTSGK